MAEHASPLLPGLLAFTSGTRRSDLPELVLKHIAVGRFVIIAESSIEGKHAAVSLDSQRGIGPVRVSLANRLPLMESRMQQHPMYLHDLVECFHEARNFRRIPAIMGFENHPLLEGRRFKHISEMVPVLAAIVYRCNLDDVFDDKDEYSRYHTNMRERL